jgi:hypothetical protein
MMTVVHASESLHLFGATRRPTILQLNQSNQPASLSVLHVGIQDVARLLDKLLLDVRTRSFVLLLVTFYTKFVLAGQS